MLSVETPALVYIGPEVMIFFFHGPLSAPSLTRYRIQQMYSIQTQNNMTVKSNKARLLSLIQSEIFAFDHMHLKISSGKCVVITGLENFGESRREICQEDGDCRVV